MHFTAACHLCGAVTRVPDEYNQVDVAKVWASNWEDQHISEEHEDVAPAQEEGSETET